MALIPMFFSLSILLSCLSGFVLSTQGMFIKRTFLNMPLSIFENNVLDQTKNEDDINQKFITFEVNNFSLLNEEFEINRIFYFDMINLKNDIIEYINYSLKNKINTYYFGIRFYEYDDGVFKESEEYPNGVKIRLVCNHHEMYNIDTSLSFFIEEGSVIEYEWTFRTIF